MNKLLNEDINRIKSLIKENIIVEQTTVIMAEPINMSRSKHNFWQLRKKDNFGYSGGGTYNHKGTDISADPGTPVKSPMDGVVKIADINHNDACGGTIDIDHGNEYITRFCHMSKISVTVGQFVKMGEVVGESGGARGSVGAGNSKGPHLHWTLMKKSGGFADPDKIVNTSVPVGDFEGMNISSTPSGEQTPTTSIASNNSTLIPDKVNQSEEQELLKKIMDSEYLGMEVKEWINASKNPKDLFSFVMKMLDLVF
jgi:murein DD-endopeptidase MepM/ murein hydrolase activator NlpD